MVAKWRKRQTVEGLKTGPKEPRSTILTEAEEAAIVAFRSGHAAAPRSPSLCLRPSIPHLICATQTSACSDEPLRCYRFRPNHERNFRQPDVEGNKPKRQVFKRYTIGFPHTDMTNKKTSGHSSQLTWLRPAVPQFARRDYRYPRLPRNKLFSTRSSGNVSHDRCCQEPIARQIAALAAS